MIVTEGVKETLRARALVNSTVRRLLDSKSFLEVETPVLEATCGGADARPFVTYHNALSQSFTLRIATYALAPYQCHRVAGPYSTEQWQMRYWVMIDDQT